MNLFGDRWTQQGEAAAKGAEIGRSLGIEVGEAAVHQVATQLPREIAEAPTLQVLHDAAAQQTIRGDSVPPRALRKRATGRQTSADQLEQSRVVHELIDGIEQIVFE